MQASKSKVEQLPLKGFFVSLGKSTAGREVVMEGMGGNRVRIHIKPKKG